MVTRISTLKGCDKIIFSNGKVIGEINIKFIEKQIKFSELAERRIKMNKTLNILDVGSDKSILQKLLKISKI